MEQETLRAFHLPRWETLPSLALYLDQVVTVTQEALGALAPAGEPVITATIINNYVKQRVLPPTEKKRYSRSQLADLLLLTLLKRVLSTSEMAAVLRRLKEGRDEETAYELFRLELEHSLHGAEAPEGCPPLAASAAEALAGKLRFQALLASEEPEAETAGRKRRR